MLNNICLIKTRKDHLGSFILYNESFFATHLKLKPCLLALNNQETLAGQTVPYILWSFCAWSEAFTSFGSGRKEIVDVNQQEKGVPTTLFPNFNQIN